MDSKQTVKSYIGYPAKKKLLLLVIALAFVACIVLAVAQGSAKAPDPVQLTADTKNGTQCYLDVVGVSDWVVEETTENSSNHVKTRVRYYLVIDEEENYYLARIPDSQMYRLSDQERYFETGVRKPAPVRLTGRVDKLSSDVRKTAIEALEVDEETFDRILQDRFLFVGAAYNNPISIIAAICAVLLSAPLIILLISWLQRSKNAKLALKGLEEQNLMDYAAAELGEGAAQQELNDKLRLGSRFLFGREVGLAAPWQDVLWCYQRKQTIEFVTTRYFMVGIADGKLRSVPVKKRDDMQVRALMEQFAARNPDLMLGYTMANMKEYRRLCKERKAK